jgi:hypothetical protein
LLLRSFDHKLHGSGFKFENEDIKNPVSQILTGFGREEEIRTLDALQHTHFPGVLLQPLGHLSVYEATKVK